eukprot:504725-Pyramimonas_sp.AAC.1
MLPCWLLSFCVRLGLGVVAGHASAASVAAVGLVAGAGLARCDVEPKLQHVHEAVVPRAPFA